MVDSIGATVNTSIVETTEAPFIPGAPEIQAVLQPVPGEGVFLPPTIPLSPLDTPAPEVTKAMIIDIETTGADPWESRITCIVAMDPRFPDDLRVFADKDEQKIIDDFLAFFDAGDFNQLIGYNISFDFRWIFSRMMLYLKRNARFLNIELLDMMQVMKQVQLNFVFGFNKQGSLGDWAGLLFGLGPLLTFEENLKAWEEGRIQDIIDHCKNDVNMTFLLWLTWQFVIEEV